MNYNYLNDKTSLGLTALVAAQRRPSRNLLDPNRGPAFGRASMTPTVGQLTSEQTSTFLQVATAASIGLSAYHGYKRNDDLAWGIIWGLLGGIFPIITPAIALAEGYAVRSR